MPHETIWATQSLLELLDAYGHDQIGPLRVTGMTPQGDGEFEYYCDPEWGCNGPGSGDSAGQKYQRLVDVYKKTVATKEGYDPSEVGDSVEDTPD